MRTQHYLKMHILSLSLSVHRNGINGNQEMNSKALYKLTEGSLIWVAMILSQGFETCMFLRITI